MALPVRTIAALIITLLAQPMSVARAQAPGQSPDEKAVVAADTAFHDASLLRKGQAWRDFAEADATSGDAHGREAIGAQIDKLYAQPETRLDWQPAAVRVIGDVAVTDGHYQLHQVAADGKSDDSTGRYVTVWRRQADGRWLYVWDGGTPDKQ